MKARRGHVLETLGTAQKNVVDETVYTLTDVSQAEYDVLWLGVNVLSWKLMELQNHYKLADMIPEVLRLIDGMHGISWKLSRVLDPNSWLDNCPIGIGKRLAMSDFSFVTKKGYKLAIADEAVN